MIDTDRVLRIMELAGQIAQAAGKGTNQSGESEEWGSGLKNWRKQLAEAAYALEHEARAIVEKTGWNPEWLIVCNDFDPTPTAFNGSCGNCKNFDWASGKCKILSKKAQEVS